MIKYNGEVDKKFNDFAERYADVITVTKKRTPQELDLSGDYGFCPYAVPKNCLTHKLTYVEDVNDYRLPDIGHNKDYYESRIIPEVLTPTDIIGDDAYFDKKKFMLSTQLCDFFSAFPYKSDKAGCAR